MRYLTLAPSPALADSVEALWAYEGYRPPHAFERIFPSGTVELLLNLTDGRLRCHDPRGGQMRGEWSGLLVAGVHRDYQLVETAQQYAMLGVALRPGGAWRLLGVAADELADRHVPLDALVGSAADGWAERLWNIQDPLARLRWLEATLARRVRRPLHSAVEWAAEQIVRFPDSARVGVLADETGLSARRFQALFRREIGVAPKAFARIRRFQSTLGRVRNGRATDFAVLATEMGYADQAHLIREFKAHSGFTPAQYRVLTLECLTHVPHPEQDQMCPVSAVDCE